MTSSWSFTALQWRHNGRDSVSNHQPHDCLLNRLFRRRSKKTPKFRVTGLCAGNSPVTGEFPAQTASNAENVFIWWCRHGTPQTFCILLTLVMFYCLSTVDLILKHAMDWSSPNIVTSTTGTQYLALTADIWGCFFIQWLFIHYTYALALLWNIDTYSSTLKRRGGLGFSKAISSDFFIINKPTRIYRFTGFALYCKIARALTLKFTYMWCQEW